MDKTYAQLQQDLLDAQESKKNLKERVSSLKFDLQTHVEKEKALIVQYERIITSWRKQYQELLKNGWKILFTKIVLRYKKLRGEKEF